MLEKSIALLFMLIGISGCEKIIEDFRFEYDEDKLVVLGRINNLEGVYVKLTHTLPPIGDFYFDGVNIDVTGATIVLFENNIIADTLHESEPGIYTSSVLPTSGNLYHLQCIKEGYATLISEQVRMPDEGYDGEILFESGFTNINGDPAIHVIPSFTDNNAIENFYVFGFRFYSGTAIVSNDVVYEYPSSDAFGCEAPGADINSIDYRTFSDNCFSGLSFPFGFEVASNYYSDTVVQNFTAMILYAGNISEEYYKFGQSITEVSGADLIFADPKITYSNMSGGYGVFWAENIVVFDYTF